MSERLLQVILRPGERGLILRAAQRGGFPNISNYVRNRLGLPPVTNGGPREGAGRKPRVAVTGKEPK